ncbi:YcxB family protein [Streptomyces huiliensis]|uniref:YcxB family protein n=1 Tax=Streptomyces huiliensis TaxID=2876027 RepID=UPI001CBE776C|nr:YcxB family protein [Streptomyces huiliensis]MBZ4323067.1 YcxB family protein [Streptomyces huiliensis]
MEQRSSQSVELAYLPAVEDFKEALGARSKVSRAARRSRRMLSGALVVSALLVAMSWWSGKDLPVPVLVMLPVLALMRWYTPWAQARQFLRMAEGNGVHRISVADSGLTVSHERATTTLAWQAAPRYAETPGQFVLFGGDDNASCLTVLPKRGLQDPAGADRLRALLDRHLTRV